MFIMSDEVIIQTPNGAWLQTREGDTRRWSFMGQQKRVKEFATLKGMHYVDLTKQPRKAPPAGKGSSVRGSVSEGASV